MSGLLIDAYDWSPEQRDHVKNVECLRLLRTLKQNTLPLVAVDAVPSPGPLASPTVASTSQEQNV